MDERTSDESDDPLVGQSTEETRPDNKAATVDCNETNTADLVASILQSGTKNFRRF